VWESLMEGTRQSSDFESAYPLAGESLLAESNPKACTPSRVKSLRGRRSSRRHLRRTAFDAVQVSNLLVDKGIPSRGLAKMVAYFSWNNN
jgi:hypothetical protein